MAKRNGTSGVETLLKGTAVETPKAVASGNSANGITFEPPPTPVSATSNARWLAAAIELLKNKFALAEADKLWGRTGIFIVFKDGEAIDIHHDGGGKVRVF